MLNGHVFDVVIKIGNLLDPFASLPAEGRYTIDHSPYFARIIHLLLSSRMGELCMMDYLLIVLICAHTTAWTKCCGAPYLSTQLLKVVEQQ